MYGIADVCEQLRRQSRNSCFETHNGPDLSMARAQRLEASPILCSCEIVQHSLPWSKEYSQDSTKELQRTCQAVAGRTIPLLPPTSKWQVHLRSQRSSEFSASLCVLHHNFCRSIACASQLPLPTEFSSTSVIMIMIGDLLGSIRPLCYYCT